jgi:hypothetical protein
MSSALKVSDVQKLTKEVSSGDTDEESSDGRRGVEEDDLHSDAAELLLSSRGLSPSESERGMLRVK